MDDIDRKLLLALQADGRATAQTLSEAVHLSASQCQRRIRRLEDEGIIRDTRAILDPARIGLAVMAIVSVSLVRHGTDPARAFREAVDEAPEILECYAVTGESDYALKVVTTDLQAFAAFLRERMLSLPVVASVRTNVLLEELKSTTALPLPAALFTDRHRD